MQKQSVLWTIQPFSLELEIGRTGAQIEQVSKENKWTYNNARKDRVSRSPLTLEEATEGITQVYAKRYLCFILDNIGSFRNHISRVVKKIEESVSTLSRLMRNLGSPESQTRILLSGVVQFKSTIRETTMYRSSHSEIKLEKNEKSPKKNSLKDGERIQDGFKSSENNLSR